MGLPGPGFGSRGSPVQIRAPRLGGTGLFGLVPLLWSCASLQMVYSETGFGRLLWSRLDAGSLIRPVDGSRATGHCRRMAGSRREFLVRAGIRSAPPLTPSASHPPLARGAYGSPCTRFRTATEQISVEIDAQLRRTTLKGLVPLPSPTASAIWPPRPARPNIPASQSIIRASAKPPAVTPI